MLGAAGLIHTRNNSPDDGHDHLAANSPPARGRKSAWASTAPFEQSRGDREDYSCFSPTRPALRRPITPSKHLLSVALESRPENDLVTCQKRGRRALDRIDAVIGHGRRDGGHQGQPHRTARLSNGVEHGARECLGLVGKSIGDDEIRHREKNCVTGQLARKVFIPVC